MHDSEGDLRRTSLLQDHIPCRQIFPVGNADDGAVPGKWAQRRMPDPAANTPATHDSISTLAMYLPPQKDVVIKP